MDDIKRPTKHQTSQNDAEESMLETMDRAKLFTQLEPLLKAAVKYGGGAETMLSKSQAFAAFKLLTLMDSPDEGIALNAAKEVLNRALGKAVERKISFNANMNEMTDAELDKAIKGLIRKDGPGAAIDKAVETVVVNAKRSKIKQKPRTDV